MDENNQTELIVPGVTPSSTVFNGPITLPDQATLLDFIRKNFSAVPSGAIMTYGGSSAPSGWLLCDGSAVSRTIYSAIYSVISTVFGSGDGSTTFNLPDLRAKIPAGYKSGDSNFGTLGGVVGEATHVLTTTEMPAHKHGIPGNPGSATTGSSSGRLTDTTDLYDTLSAGGGVAHNNIQPSLTINFIIKI